MAGAPVQQTSSGAFCISSSASLLLRDATFYRPEITRSTSRSCSELTSEVGDYAPQKLNERDQSIHSIWSPSFSSKSGLRS
jgi:hypothetical protein